MRRGRRNKIRRERMIMIASSALVMGALTLTGVYVKRSTTIQEDDGYTVDFGALEQKVEQPAENFLSPEISAEVSREAGGEEMLLGENGELLENEDALDYAPVEAGSALVEIRQADVEEMAQGSEGMLTESLDQLLEEADRELLAEEELPEEIKEELVKETAGEAKKETVKETAKENAKESVKEREPLTLAYAETQGLVRPVEGEVILPYSMESSIYFSTLDQYKYHPAVVLSAQEGDAVFACANGRVLNVYEDPQIGKSLRLDLGNGFEVIYGQLTEVAVQEGTYVTAGSILGSVAAPTKYYALEGPNLYFAMTKDGEPMDPELLFR